MADFKPNTCETCALLHNAIRPCGHCTLSPYKYGDVGRENCWRAAGWFDEIGRLRAQLAYINELAHDGTQGVSATYNLIIDLIEKGAVPLAALGYRTAYQLFCVPAGCKIPPGSPECDDDTKCPLLIDDKEDRPAAPIPAGGLVGQYIIKELARADPVSREWHGCAEAVGCTCGVHFPYTINTMCPVHACKGGETK